MRRKMVVALSAATVALLLLFMAVPALTAPAVAITQPTTSNTASKSVQTTQMNWEWQQWFNNNTRSFFTSYMAFQMSNNWMEGVFNLTGMPNVKFGLTFAKLVEFNDTNGDKHYNFNETSPEILKEYNLLTDIDWNLPPSVTWDPLVPSPSNPLRYVQVNLTGQEKNGAFHIYFIITLNLKPTTITFNGTEITLPSELTLKFEMDILGYQWSPTNNTYPADYRFLALVILLNGSVAGSVPHNFVLWNGTHLGDLGNIPSPPGTAGKVGEIYFADSSGIIHGKFSWFNGAYNVTTKTSVGPGYTYFNKSGDTVQLSIAYAYNDFPSGNILIDPYFEMYITDYMTMLITLLVLWQMYTSQAASSTLLYAGIGIVTAIVIIGAAVVLIRRR